MIKNFGSRGSYEIIRRLEKADFEAVFVGGAVRDYFLDKPAKDIDIATSAEPYEVKAIFSNTVDVGVDHGTVLVIIEGEPIEVTTYRTDGVYTDHRRPDEVQFVKSLREDLLRRDFTMNALALRKDGEVIDLFGGISDMENKIIRAVGNPTDRFLEDALRMIRAIRFSSVLDFDIEINTLEAIQTSASEINHVSIERLKIEMDKLFMGINPAKAFNYLEVSGLGDAIPLFTGRLDVLNRALPFVSPLEGWAYISIMGDLQSAELARVYKLSNDESRFISSVHEAYQKRVSGVFTISEYYKFDLAVLVCTEKFYRSVYIDSPTLKNSELERNKHDLPIQSAQDLTINGKDLIKWAGIAGGRWTGVWIEKIEHAVLHSLCENDPIKIKDWFMHDFESKR